MDPEVVAITVGCGVSHKNYSTIRHVQFKLSEKELYVYRKANDGVNCTVMRFYELSGYIKHVISWQ
jgi:hypothetical protein